ncbi:MAG: ATP-binding protein [Fibrobacteria bacterium]|nr:ATP-binding protein [Fibrobacteria bacterium]
MQTIQVDVQHDHISKLASISPEKALAEIIWNALDAESRNVTVEFERNELATQQIRIIDDGHAFNRTEAATLFSFLGGSWKRNIHKSPNIGRFIHGQGGQGRFRAFGLGNMVEWTSVYTDGLKKFSFKISGSIENIKSFNITEPHEVDSDAPTGVTVTISNIDKNQKFFEEDVALEKITPIFALYLVHYPNVNITVDEKKLEAKKVIESHKRLALSTIKYEGQTYTHEIELIQWKGITLKDTFFSDSAGFPLERYDRKIKGVGDCSYSVYLKSDFYRKMNDGGLLFFPDNIEELQEAIMAGTETAQEYFASKNVEKAKSQVEIWKTNQVYPYQGKAAGTKEKAQRKTFDTIALNINKYLPDFEKANNPVKAFCFKMLRQSIETTPGELVTLLNEAMPLPKDKQKELKKLL